jgi:uncharacterized membrane protein
MVTATAPRVTRPAEERTVSARFVVVAAGALSVVLALVLLGVTGALAAPSGGLLDPGAFTRYGLPAARALHDLAASATVGLLVLAAWAVGPDAGKSVDSLAGPRRLMVRGATLAALVWAGAAAVVLVLTAADVSGYSPAAAGFSLVFFSFTSQLALGRALLVSLLLVLLAAAISTLATRVVAVAWARGGSVRSVTRSCAATPCWQAAASRSSRCPASSTRHSGSARSRGSRRRTGCWSWARSWPSGCWAWRAWCTGAGRSPGS